MVSCLLIDRDDAQRLRLQTMLATLGIDCTSVAKADDGLNACARLRPDFVLVAAPEAKAVGPFLRRAKSSAMPLHAPAFLFYSTQPDMSVIGETILNGAADFLMLPFDADLLRFKLKQAGALPAQAA